MIPAQSSHIPDRKGLGHESPVHHRRRRRISDCGSHLVRAAFARDRTDGGLRRTWRAGEAGDAPVHHRNRHENLPERGRTRCRYAPHARRTGPRGRKPRPASRGRGHPSIFQLDRSGHLAGRTLPEYSGRNGAVGAFAADFRHARARRGAGSYDHDRSDEHGAVFSAASAGAFDQLAILDGPRYRAEVISHNGVPAVSTHRDSGSFGFVEPVRGLRGTFDSAALDR